MSLKEKAKDKDKEKNKEKIIQWFPGHMAKTRRIMRESLPLVDVVVELRDARVVHSSRNPEIEKIVGKKPRIILLNKSDGADENVTAAWVEFFKKKGISALAVDCKNGRGLKEVMPAVRDACADLLQRQAMRQMETKPLRIMVVGIPNVGKSSFINRMAKSRKAKVEDRPGVTLGKQWIKLDDGAELLDMPGVLWPKFEDVTVGRNLAYTGAIKDTIMDLEDLAATLCNLLMADYRKELCGRYSLTEEEITDKSGFEVLTLIAQKRKMVRAGGLPDTLRASTTLLDEFRGGKIGRISLEKPRTMK